MNSLRSLIFWTAACGVAIAADGPVDLFNGKTLEGWVQRGGQAKYSIEDGCIVGTSTLNTENTFLCTPRDYGDFVLEYEFKVDPKLNSGVQIRSQCFATPTEIDWQGKTIQSARRAGARLSDRNRSRTGQKPLVERRHLRRGGRGWLYPGSLGGDG